MIVDRKMKRSKDKALEQPNIKVSKRREKNQQKKLLRTCSQRAKKY